MEKLFSEKLTRWVTPLVLICYVLTVMTFPTALGKTYADKTDPERHVLVYTQNDLAWLSPTDVDPDTGVAQLRLFDAEYDGVRSADGKGVVAPGTRGESTVRLQNRCNFGEIFYTAVLYRIRSNDALPVHVTLEAKGAKDTGDYTLPEGVEESQVIRAVTGMVIDTTSQDFAIHWNWDFYESDAQDVIDTMLANQEEDITVGLYIVVQDHNNYLNPRTADDAHLGMYTGLLLISGFLLVMLLLDWRREDEEEALEC